MFRQLFDLWKTKASICTIQEYLNLQERGKSFALNTQSSCRIVYTFVAGGATSKTAPLVRLDQQEGNITTTPPPCKDDAAGCDWHNTNTTDMTWLNIRENMDDGKSQTWFYYASQFSDIHYVAKMDTDSLLLVDQFVDFCDKFLPPPPFNKNKLAATFCEKSTDWARERKSLKERFFARKFDSLMHLYAHGQFYLMSMDLAQTVLQEARINPNAAYLEGLEDHDISAMAFHSDEPLQLILIDSKQRFWNHGIKLKRGFFEEKWQQELDRSKAMVQAMSGSGNHGTSDTGRTAAKTSTALALEAAEKVSTAAIPNRAPKSPARGPPPIDLFSDNHPGIRQRHECISNIRQRHQQLLTPLFIPSSENQDTLLVDPAYHENVGDHMLTFGELTFLDRAGFINASQCDYSQSMGKVPKCNKVIGELPPAQVAGQAALWHAGGNWGDLYPYTHRPRISSFPKLLEANYSIVGMPQSLYFKNKRAKNGQTLKSSILQGIFNSTEVNLDDEVVASKVRSRVTLTWREHESHDEAVELYPWVNHLVVPDIAFQLGPYKRIQPEPDQAVDFIVFLRDDRESTEKDLRNEDFIRTKMNEIAPNMNTAFKIVDWKDRLDLFNSTDNLFTETAIQLLSMGRVAIVDRLHAAILVYLAGLPFVYINQLTGKLERTLRVAFESWDGCQDGETSMYSQADNLTDTLSKANMFLHKYNLLPPGT